MTAETKTSLTEDLANAVLQGFSSRQKTLPSWLFYDETGDRLFQEIMRMPEYYPTRCEYDILQQSKETLTKHFLHKARSFQRR
jgi:L-histidine N-alpha-methyltransferase